MRLRAFPIPLKFHAQLKQTGWRANRPEPNFSPEPMGLRPQLRHPWMTSNVSTQFSRRTCNVVETDITAQRCISQPVGNGWCNILSRETQRCTPLFFPQLARVQEPLALAKNTSKTPLLVLDGAAKIPHNLLWEVFCDSPSLESIVFARNLRCKLVRISVLAWPLWVPCVLLCKRTYQSYPTYSSNWDHQVKAPIDSTVSWEILGGNSVHIE